MSSDGPPSVDFGRRLSSRDAAVSRKPIRTTKPRTVSISPSPPQSPPHLEKSQSHTATNAAGRPRVHVVVDGHQGPVGAGSRNQGQDSGGGRPSDPRARHSPGQGHLPCAAGASPRPAGRAIRRPRLRSRVCTLVCDAGRRRDPGRVRGPVSSRRGLAAREVGQEAAARREEEE
ncbi:hypothetical protein OCS_02229 [Ophiocordyceps sinensis CO18]|uniref:Uncharacterized protein n=1 Tax=Ophiocordyceps sinensis (strain Co18 / CGMCC 3.14243) TaxID=911162 RepID=T5AJP5_OPHSC|nr:hypothetical protein OCS_02229 [Ophiocordyceps sinensis CO18]